LQLRAADGRILFLKEKPYYLYDDEFEFHLRLHCHVQQQNGPVVPLLVSASGGMVFLWEGRQFKLLEWMPGRHLCPSQPTELLELGSLIARFQIAALDFKSEYAGDWGFPRNRSFFCPERWAEILEYTKYIHYAFTALQKPEPRALSWIRDWVMRHGTSIEWQDLPQQFTHGDADYFNSVKGTTGDLALVDLDDAHWGYRIIDLTCAAAVVGGMLPTSEEDAYALASGGWQWQRIEILVSGFERLSCLTDVESSCFKSLLGLSLVRLLVGGLDLDEPSTAIPPEAVLLDQLDALVAMLEALE
jgi:Ser/Thr protein kinase RdoA (MazF antagonist)